jgi:hypothetical protein
MEVRSQMDQGCRLCIEPRKMYSRGHWIIPHSGRKPTLWIERKAAVLKALWQVFRTPPGSETRACAQRGSSGTWEIQMFPCVKERYWEIRL